MCAKDKSFPLSISSSNKLVTSLAMEAAMEAERTIGATTKNNSSRPRKTREKGGNRKILCSVLVRTYEITLQSERSDSLFGRLSLNKIFPSSFFSLSFNSATVLVLTCWHVTMDEVRPRSWLIQLFRIRKETTAVKLKGSSIHSVPCLYMSAQAVRCSRYYAKVAIQSTPTTKE